MPIAACLQPFVDSHALAGAVTLVASKNQVLDLDAVGYADLTAKKPMRTDSFFWIASLSKPITAAAFMMLVDEGLVNVEDPVEKHLPKFKGQMLEVEKDERHILLRQPSRPITVRDILSHTSGLPFLTRLEPRIDVLPLHEAAIAYALSNLESQPGSKYTYSNVGINTAGRIIEVLAGMPFEQFLQERLFDPLGMKETTFFPSAEQLARLPKAYKPNADKTALEETTITQCTYPLDRRDRFAHPAGGLFSTATDLSQFCRMILSGGQYEGRRYLSPASIRQMTTTQTCGLPVPQTKPETGGGYGFGWVTSCPDPGNTDAALVGECRHGGALYTHMRISAQHQLATIYLVQHAGYAGPNGDKIMPTFEEAAVAAFAK